MKVSLDVNFAFTVTGSISSAYLRPDVLLSLRKQANTFVEKKLPNNLSIELRGHVKAVNTVEWSACQGESLPYSSKCNHSTCTKLIIRLIFLLNPNEILYMNGECISMFCSQCIMASC